MFATNLSQYMPQRLVPTNSFILQYLDNSIRKLILSSWFLAMYSMINNLLGCIVINANNLVFIVFQHFIQLVCTKHHSFFEHILRFKMKLTKWHYCELGKHTSKEICRNCNKTWCIMFNQKDSGKAFKHNCQRRKNEDATIPFCTLCSSKVKQAENVVGSI